MPRALDPRVYTNELFAKAAAPAASQRVLTLGVAAEVVASWAKAVGPTGSVTAVEHWLPDWRSLESAARQSQGMLRVHFAATLAPVGDASFELCAIDVASYPSTRTLALLAQAAAEHLGPGGTLLAAGPKNAGILSFARRLETLLGNAKPLAYRKGQRVVASYHTGDLTPIADPAATSLYVADLAGERWKLQREPGVFAGGAIDDATAMLAEAMTITPDDRCLDLGCGCGILGMVAARRAPAQQAVLVDSDAFALELAKRNCARNGIGNARIVPADIVDTVAEERFTVVACSPPLHPGREHGGSTIADQFMQGARSVLEPGGRLYLAVHRFLPYEGRLAAIFDAVEEIAGDERTKVLMATVAPS
jgi:16S rRNA (guanine1207-N2)-methyltransferase